MPSMMGNTLFGFFFGSFSCVSCAFAIVCFIRMYCDFIY
jgi:hypothetical protein